MHKLLSTIRSLRRFGFALAVLALALGAAACGDDDPVGTAGAGTVDRPAAAATSLEVVARDHAFEVSTASLAPGRIPVELRNEGAEPHQLMVARLHEGVTVADYLAAFEESELAAEDLIDFGGGVNVVDPGATRTGYADLEAGRYVVLCFLPTADGTSHLHAGMVAELTVVEAPAVAPPTTVGEITMADFSFALPEGGLSGAGAYRVVNAGRSNHELVLMRVDEGKDVGDVAAYLQGGFRGERPLSFVGGAGGVAPGADTFIDLDLAPGDYVAMCFIGDAATGRRHAELGMVSTFTVP